MKKILEKYNSTNLVLRIAAGLVIGVLLGAFFPKLPVIGILGDVFVGALKAIAPLLVFVLVISSISNASGSIGGRFRNVIILYMVSTLSAAAAAVAASYIFPITLILETASEGYSAPGGIGEVIENLVLNAVTNPVKAISEANYIGVLSWAVLIGLGIKSLKNDALNNIMQGISDAVSKVVHWIISVAPFGILGLVFTLVSENGISVFAAYGKLLALLVGCMLTVSLVLNPAIVGLCLRKNPYPLVFRCLKESGLTAFFTRSSAANIPINMELCRRLHLNKDFYSVSIPLGATINMDGAAITITIMTLAAAHTLGISVDFPSAVLLSFTAAIGACGSSGVAGGSLLLIPMACSIFGIDNSTAMQVVGIGFIIGVVQDSLETALNSSGDVLFAAAADYMEQRRQGKKIEFLYDKSI